MCLRLAEYDLEHLILLPLHPECWDYRHKPPLCSMYAGLRMEPRALDELGQHSPADPPPTPRQLNFMYKCPDANSPLSFLFLPNDGHL